MRNRLSGYGRGPMAVAGLLCLLATGMVLADEAASRGKEDRLPGRGDGREGSVIRIRLGDAGGPARCVAVGRKDSAEQTVQLVVEDVKGTYAIPYIQSSRVLKTCIEFNDPGVAEAEVALTRAVGSRSRATGIDLDTTGQSARGSLAHGMSTRLLHGPAFVAEFGGLEPGEYTLEVEGRNGEGRSMCRAKYSLIGIGTIVAAIGDSITEGYYGRGFMREKLELTSGDFPADAVSRDGRNFPQYAPTTHEHLPSVNCFESWMPRLNDLLSGKWRQPVFIANEGWGGITSGGYLDMMRSDANWRTRMQALKPSLWLIHLGVNDERALVSAEGFAANMNAVVELLVGQYGAKPGNIFIAKPCFDYFDGGKPILEGYCRQIDQLVAARGLRHGADFFSAYAVHKEKWYGDDPVHPTEAGIRRMADLWREVLTKALPKGPEP